MCVCVGVCLYMLTCTHISGSPDVYLSSGPERRGTMCESTAAEAVDDMQRMDVARIRNGKRPTGGGGATHTKGRTKADHHAEGRTKRPTGGCRGTHTGNTQTFNAAYSGNGLSSNRNTPNEPSGKPSLSTAVIQFGLYKKLFYF